MKILIALGGNALLKRGEKLSAEIQKNNVKIAVKEIAKLVLDQHQIIICHGNGPQVGLLALQSMSTKDIDPYPFDVLGAETQGMIGYMIQQELSNVLDKKIYKMLTLITQVEVDPNDAAFKNPKKPIGPVYSKEQAEELQKLHHWNIMKDGEYYRRAIASPKPKKIVEIKAIEVMLQNSIIPICSGGGGIPVALDAKGNYYGVEAVIDKDLSSALLAQSLNVDLFIIASDVEGVYLNFKQENQQLVHRFSVKEIEKYQFPEGSMKPKVDACVNFVQSTSIDTDCGFKRRASIGLLSFIDKIVSGESGTHIYKN